MRRESAGAAEDGTAGAGLSIAVELVTGRGQSWWPRPGRVFAASSAHTFADLAEAIDVAFGRRDLDHLRMFVLPGGVEVSWSAWRDGPAFPGTLDGRLCRLDLLPPGASFAYVFDLGEDWTHLCTVRRADDRCLRASRTPYPMHGWGAVPDQHARNLPGEHAPTRPSRHAMADLPPILPSWGARR
ncbi:plasmid pRiA4b ORF-3 family protein [Micromonospora sp. NBC_00898]|uniref:IS1096 element passenger TnpR family protein n=1 Tax=Micromonospora sp. NBC_00898 TaxID=2975981 RepID=UPI00386B8980|nr:plasmid pRiA4b ORF-3 family protein [Micromonospora sp. NBC_00898]